MRERERERGEGDKMRERMRLWEEEDEVRRILVFFLEGRGDYYSTDERRMVLMIL